MNHCIECGNTLELIKGIPRKSVDLIVTSPPYWTKRVYNGMVCCKENHIYN